MVGGFLDPTYRKANEARMISSPLPPWLKRIINTRVTEATQHGRPPPSKNCGTFWNTVSLSMTTELPMNGAKPSTLGWLKGSCPS